MDIPQMWRSMHPDSDEMPRLGAHLDAAASGITVTVAQQCQVTLPLTVLTVDEVTVTVTSHRPGVAAKVSVGVNLNSVDFSYQGPTTTVGQAHFTATDSQVHIGFAVLPTAERPFLGIGAEAIWADGAAASIDLTYVEIPCNMPPWVRWLIRIMALRGGPFTTSTRTGG